MKNKEELNKNNFTPGSDEIAKTPEFDQSKALQNKAEKQAEIDGYKIESFQDYPDEYEDIDENEEDIDGVPQTLWRGERLFLGNIEERIAENISTVGHERKGNQNGKVFMARDKKFASLYAVGTDGVKWYDGPLSVDEIPIGVVYKIRNSNNHLEAEPTYDEPEQDGPFPGKIREFTTDSIPPEDYEISHFYIMDDFLQPNGHKRSDMRRPIEVIKILDQKKIPEKKYVEIDD